MCVTPIQLTVHAFRSGMTLGLEGIHFVHIIIHIEDEGAKSVALSRLLYVRGTNNTDQWLTDQLNGILVHMRVHGCSIN